jgi:hypothetical protein
MPLIDRREIEFEADVLIAAVAASPKAAQSFGLPVLMPIRVRFYPKEGEVDFLFGSLQAPQAVRLKSDLVGALLVAYCLRIRIPMPKKASKGVQIEPDSVILTFRTHCVAPVPNAESQRMPAATAVTSWAWVDPQRVPTR